MDSELLAISRQLKAIVKEVSRITGLESRWNGIVELNDERDYGGQPAFRARKQFSCSIHVHQAVVSDPNRFLTLVHEAAHSVSVGLTPPAFRDYPGYEEGVVEYITRRFGPRIAEGMGIPADFNARDSFPEPVALLDRLRVATRMEADSFYLELLATPLAQREAEVVQWAIEANSGESPARVLARIAPTMRKLR